MKKLTFVILGVLICSSLYSRNYEHQIIKKVIVAKPSFTVYTVKDSSDWFANQIEDTLIKNNIPIIISKSGNTESNVESGVFIFKENTKVTSSNVNLFNTNATYVLIANYSTWEFKVIFTKTQELLVKGFFRNEIPDEITLLLKEMGLK